MDTDLYVLSGQNIPPNVLVILDNSASMDEVDQNSGEPYDPAVDYSAYGPSTTYPRYAAYMKSGANWNEWVPDYRSISCTDLRDNYLAPYGEAINYSGCSLSKKDFQTGNFRNFLQLTLGQGANRSRFGLSTAVLRSYINTTTGVRFGMMSFNNDSTGNKVIYDKANPDKGEFVFGDSRDDALDANGARLLGFVDENKAGKTELFNNLSVLKNETWSPLAESLYEAGLFFQKGKSAITETNYASSPVQYWCQKNYVIIISDGNPTKDSHEILASLIGDRTGDGQSGKLDDVAKYLHGLDLSNGQNPNGQNIIVYTIGFTQGHTLLQNTARAGGGKYTYVYSSQSFYAALQIFIAEVLKESTSYVAPVVPISQMERTSSGNRLFLAMFKPMERSFWKGNIKKYGIATKIPEGEANNIGDLLDSGGKLATNNNNQIYDKVNGDSYSAQSYWSSVADGQNVEAGGVGEKLQERDFTLNPRKIYTYLGTNINITDLSNAFNKTNITPQKLGLSVSDTTGRDKVVDFIYGWDVYDENLNNKTDEKRGWILGSFIHSRPTVIHYGNPYNISVIFAGANDGMLHAFHNGVPSGDTWTDGTGEELWAFIPPGLLDSLKNLNDEALQFFVDGSPKAYIGKDGAGNDVKYLIFGLRRGGNRYIALDVTNPTSPKWLWEVSPSTSGFGELGQTWSTPLMGKIKYGSGEKRVFFIGGGYDENQDLSTPGNDTKGRAVYVVDVLTGEPIWSYTNNTNAQMKYCIPSDVARVDTNGDGYIDRLYVGDMGGQIWRFDIDVRDANNQNNTANWKGGIIFRANPGASEKRKIFYPPDVTLEKGNYEMLFFGSGDREAPKEKTVINRLYAVKDKNLSTILTENDLFDVTSVEATFTTVDAESGWYIRLENVGEKSLSPSVVFHGVVYYTTFTPSIGEPGDVCFLGEGTGRLYALKYKTGYAALDLNDDGTISPIGDRSTVMGEEGKTTIPSGVIITFIGGKAVAYAGVGGGVYIPPLPSTKSLIPINWRTVTK
jgi:type IV pilus assembly protein PilY1